MTASQLARSAAARFGFLDLARAATVAEFDTDPDIVQALVVGACDGRSDDVAQRPRDERATADRARATDKLRDPGAWAIGTPSGIDPTRYLRQLTDSHGGELTFDDHAEYPGHAAPHHRALRLRRRRRPAHRRRHRRGGR